MLRRQARRAEKARAGAATAATAEDPQCEAPVTPPRLVVSSQAPSPVRAAARAWN